MNMVDFLIVRNKCNKSDGTEDPATKFTHWYGDSFTYKNVNYNSLKHFLESKGHTVHDLSNVDASPEKVHTWMNYNDKKTRKAAILFDHGSTSAFFGEKNNLAEEVINKGNAEELTKELQIYTLACLTNAANGLGQTAVENGCNSWLGYTEVVYAQYSDPFKECIWSYIEAMADGKTMEECEAALRERYLAYDNLSFVFGYNRERMLLRKKEDGMTIESHCREEKPPDDTPDEPWWKQFCPIAAITAGSALSSHVQFLRAFRDDVVLKSAFKTRFESLLKHYYKFTPRIAKKIEKNSAYKGFLKYGLVYPFVIVARGLASVALTILAL
jgi:hypothetical protein